VIELLDQQLKELEKAGKSYIIEGFPRTRVQAIGLQSKGIIPDKFFILNMNEGDVLQKTQTALRTKDEKKKAVSEKEVDAVARKMILEYNM